MGVFPQIVLQIDTGIRRTRHSSRLTAALPALTIAHARTRSARPAEGGSGNPSVAFGDSSPFRRAYNDASMPPLKGEVPAARAVGFTFAEFEEISRSNLWRLGSCAVRRQRRLMISRKLLEIRRIQELQSMVPEFVDRTGGSRWVQAQPARRQQVEPGTARYIEHKIKSPSDASRAAEMWYNHSIHSTI